MNANAIIFDLDGTLINSLSDLAWSTNQALLKNGFPEHPQDAYRMFVGKGVAELIRLALPEENRVEETVQKLDHAFREQYAENWKRESVPYPGIRGMLDELIQADIAMAVFSNKPHDFTHFCVNEFFADIPFVDITGLNDNVPAKPDPTGALHLADMIGEKPEKIIFMGDSCIDMQTAVNAGMIPVGVLWGFRDKAELLDHGARVVLENPGDLIQYFQ